MASISHYRIVEKLGEGSKNLIGQRPCFDPLRREPRFQALLDRMKLPARQA